MSPDLRALIIDLEQVPAIDATGIFNLRSCVDRLRSRKVRVLLAGARGQTRAAMVRAGLGTGDGLSIHATVREAIESASTPLESDDQRSKEVVRDPVA
jgi:anti-anti-sigma regulatory factor